MKSIGGGSADARGTASAPQQAQPTARALSRLTEATATSVLRARASSALRPKEPVVKKGFGNVDEDIVQMLNAHNQKLAQEKDAKRGLK